MKTEKSSNNFRVISEDKLTVKNDYQTRTFIISHKHNEIGTFTMSSTSTVGALMQNLRAKLSQNKHSPQKIIFLESSSCDEVVDYALQIQSYELSHFKNPEHLNVVFGEEVKCREWISLNDFIFKKCLGQGASASVFLVRHRGTGRLYALKQIQKNYFVQFKRMEQVLREKKIMSQIIQDFPFVSKLYASFESDKHLNFVLEFYPGGEMFFHLQKHRLSQNEAKIYFAEMVLTFQFLHNQKVIYRDLKPENIMIDFNGHARLADFGLCKINLNKDQLTMSCCGSIEYMAPEVRESTGYNYSVDFYTLGAFLYEMVMGVPPYYNDQPLFFNEENSSSYKALVKGLIEEDVGERINSFKMIKTSKWLQDISWSGVKKCQYNMAFDVQPYETYIHDQFQQVPVKEHNEHHEEKFDRLFDFFTFIKMDGGNVDLMKCYDVQGKQTQNFERRSTSNRSIDMKKEKKKVGEKTKVSSNKSNSRSKKGSREKNSKSKQKSRIQEHNIYTKKTNEDHQHHRSISPKRQLVFKKTSNFKSPKAGLDIIKNMMIGAHKF